MLKAAQKGRKNVKKRQKYLEVDLQIFTFAPNTYVYFNLPNISTKSPLQRTGTAIFAYGMETRSLPLCMP